MGFSLSEENRKFLEIGKATVRPRMSDHPNYREQTPNEHESLIEFTLRYASHLVSPPMDKGESYECECIDVANEIMGLHQKVYNAWTNRRSNRILREIPPFPGLKQ